MDLALRGIARHPWLLIVGLAVGTNACDSSQGGRDDPPDCLDSDADGVCDEVDACADFDDALDADADGTPDGCDACPRDALPDLDDDGICNSLDTETCDDAVDNDGDGALDCLDADCAGEAVCAAAVPHGSLIGSVVNTTGSPVSNVRVQIEDVIALTDSGGHFLLENVPFAEGPSLVTFERSGYGTYVRVVQLVEDEVTHTRAVLKAAHVFGWWRDPTSEFVVSDLDDVRVTFPSGSLLDAQGDPVADPVNVAIVTGDPTDPLEAPIMPGDYLSDEDGGTPLDSVAFLDIEVRNAFTGAEVNRVSPGTPVVVELPIPAALQADYAVDDTIPWWSFDEAIGTWRREGVATVFDDGGTLWTRATVTHLSWWNVDNPVDTHGCICVNVVDGDEKPIAGAQVQARGVTYNGTSSPVYADEAGQACVTVKNSASSAEEVEVFVVAGSVELPYAVNPVPTPTETASCLRDIDCPERCGVLTEDMVLDRSGTVGGTVTLRSGAPAVDLLVGTDHGSSVATDASGAYSLPVFIDIPCTVFTTGYTSPELLATEVAPDVTHDIALDNLPPKLVELYVNGIAQDVGSPDGRGIFVYVDDRTQPVEFEALAVDGDGDPIAYAWTGSCYVYEPGGPGEEVPRECTPPDESITTCEAPDVGGGEPPTQEGCQYYLALDDGYVPEPVEWFIGVAEKP